MLTYTIIIALCCYYIVCDKICVLFTGVPTIVPSTVTVDSGQSVTLLCSARGNPGPTFSWFKGDIQLLDTDPRLSISGGTLTIRNIVVDDRGFYTCRANFAAGTTESQAYVSVRCELSERERGRRERERENTSPSYLLVSLVAGLCN